MVPSSGVSEKMIRHYEAIGLLHPARRANGYRSYVAADIGVLRFIRHARDLAFPREDVRRLLGLWHARGRARRGPAALRRNRECAVVACADRIVFANRFTPPGNECEEHRAC